MYDYEGYPDPDEEFELMYGDDMELLKDMEDEGESAVPKSRKALDFPPCSNTSVKVLQNVVVSQPMNLEHDFPPLSPKADIVESYISGEKRGYADLFGDIDDLDGDDIEESNLPKPKRLKQSQKTYEEEYALIEHIIELRKLARERHDSGLTATFGKSRESFADRLRDNVGYRAPKYPAVTVRRHDGDAVYVRFHSEEFEKEERDRIALGSSFCGVMGERFREIWREAKELLVKPEQSEEDYHPPLTSQKSKVDLAVQDESLLWVDRYKPRKYIELLSDESTNRTLLRWLKLWDKAVFNRRPKQPYKKASGDQQKQFGARQQELDATLEEHGRPQYKVALLCGPPGLGKTTLAHMVARHAGYKVVEINASDDRTVDVFKTALDNATQMSSVLDRERRPNCLVFDEIDGAPQAAIDFLVKYINGAHVPKPKKGQKANAHVLKRPIICICNDVYVPALRPLRQIAFVVHFPLTSSVRLVERLREIAEKEGVKTSGGALGALAEKSNNDVRSCLSVLHFFKCRNKPMTTADVANSGVGLKDVQKGLFSVWQDIFLIERPKAKDEIVTRTDRWRKVLATVTSFGDYERVGAGVFENYPSMKIKDTNFVGTCLALEWFCFSDLLGAQIGRRQEYSLATYLPYAFVVWHYAFATNHWQKISYPSTSAEVRAKKTKCSSILSDVMKGMRPAVRAYVDKKSMTFDLLPLVSEIVTPTLRPVNLHLFTPQEKEQLQSVVAIMIDYNLNYVQERNQDGNYVFNMDPNIEEIAKFTTSKQKRPLSNSNRQLVAHEIELEKMRRMEMTSKERDKSKGRVAKVEDAKMKVEEGKKETPNHLQTLTPKMKKGSSGPRNFFALPKKPTTKEEDDSGSTSIPPSDVWYEFKEGHTNAVRKHIKISKWL